MKNIFVVLCEAQKGLQDQDFGIISRNMCTPARGTGTTMERVVRFCALTDNVGGGMSSRVLTHFGKLQNFRARFLEEART